MTNEQILGILVVGGIMGGFIAGWCLGEIVGYSKGMRRTWRKK